MPSALITSPSKALATENLHQNLNVLMEEMEEHIDRLPELNKEALGRLLLSLNRFDTLQYRLRGALANELKRRAEAEAEAKGEMVQMDINKIAPVFNVKPDTLRSDMKIHNHYFAEPDASMREASLVVPRAFLRAALAVPKEEAREIIMQEVAARKKGEGCRTEDEFRTHYLEETVITDEGTRVIPPSKTEIAEVKILQVVLSMELYQAVLYLKRTLHLASPDEAIERAVAAFAEERRKLAVS